MIGLALIACGVAVIYIVIPELVIDIMRKRTGGHQ